MKMYIGVDLDGTSIRMTKADETGVTLRIIKEPAEVGKGVEQVVSEIMSMTERIEGYEAVADIGMDMPDPINMKNDEMILATSLPGFEECPIASRIEEYFHAPAFLGNDVNVVGMEETLQGAREGKDIVCYATISTGISSALVVSQEVITGRSGHAREIANLIIDKNRKKANYLNVGATENEASGATITRKGKAVFGEDVVQHADDVFDLARKGNAKALEIYDAVAYDLTAVFSQIAHVVGPGVFVIDGGVAKGKGVFFDEMENYFRSMIHEGMQTVVSMEAELGEPGIIGVTVLPMAYVKG